MLPSDRRSPTSFGIACSLDHSIECLLFSLFLFLVLQNKMQTTVIRFEMSLGPGQLKLQTESRLKVEWRTARCFPTVPFRPTFGSIDQSIKCLLFSLFLFWVLQNKMQTTVIRFEMSLEKEFMKWAIPHTLIWFCEHGQPRSKLRELQWSKTNYSFSWPKISWKYFGDDRLFNFKNSCTYLINNRIDVERFYLPQR